MALTATQISDLNNSMSAAQAVNLGNVIATVAPDTTQAMTANGAITIKSGIVTLSKSSVLAATLADPTAGTDDGKELFIIALTAQAHTVTSASSFGGGGSSYDVATYGGAIGNTMTLKAFNGKWYVKSLFAVTLA